MGMDVGFLLSIFDKQDVLRIINVYTMLAEFTVDPIYMFKMEEMLNDFHDLEVANDKK